VISENSSVEKWVSLEHRLQSTKFGGLVWCNRHLE